MSKLDEIESELENHYSKLRPIPPYFYKDLQKLIAVAKAAENIALACKLDFASIEMRAFRDLVKAYEEFEEEQE